MPTALAVAPIARAILGVVFGVLTIAEREDAAARALFDAEDAADCRGEDGWRRRRIAGKDELLPRGLVELNEMRKCAKSRQLIEVAVRAFEWLHLDEIRDAIIVIISQRAHTCLGERVQLRGTEASTAVGRRRRFSEAPGFSLHIVSLAFEKTEGTRGAGILAFIARILK